MKIKKNIGLLRVLLSERKSLIEGKKNKVFDYEFFENYFNQECEPYLQYIVSNNIIGSKTLDDRYNLLNLADKVGCLQVGMKLLYDIDPEYAIDVIKEPFNYDIVDNNRLLLDKDDLSKLLRPDYLAGILDDFGLFEDWYPEIENDEIENVLNDEEKNKLSKMMGKESFDFDDLEDTELLDELKNIYLWAYRQAGEDEVYERVMRDLKEYFQTDDIKFDEDSKGNRLLSIKIDTFLKNITHDYYTNGVYKDFDVLSDFGNFFSFLLEMIDYDDNYSTIDSLSLDYFWPDNRKVEELFHEYFNQEIG